MELEKWMLHVAVARRVVGDLWEMGTMCAEPEGVRCVRFGVRIEVVVDEEGGLGGDDE